MHSHQTSRSSRPEVFCKKGVLRNSAKCTGKHLCQTRVFFFNKKQASSLQLYFNKRLWDRCFPVNFGKFLRTHFLIEHLWWLLLNFTKIAFSKYEFGISFKKQFEKSQTKKVDEEDAILNWSVFSNEKKRNHQKRKQWSDKYFCCTFCCHSLLFVATRCSTR